MMIVMVMLNNIILMMIIQEHEGTHILQSLDGFAISLASDGRYIYVMPSFVVGNMALMAGTHKVTQISFVG